MPAASRAHALRRFAQAMTDQQQDAARLRFTVATVASIAVGAGTDGGDVVTVTLGADAVAAPHLSTYSPTVADLVWVVLVDGSPAILGRFVGLPNF